MRRTIESIGGGSRCKQGPNHFHDAVHEGWRSPAAFFPRSKVMQIAAVPVTSRWNQPDAWTGRAVTFQSNRASEVSNGPRPGVVLRWAHEPRRHARHADAHADASHSGIHTRGEECSMPAWLHSEWRLLHAYVPACSGPARASLSGKRDFKTRDEGTETASLIQFLLCRDRALAGDPRQLGAN